MPSKLGVTHLALAAALGTAGVGLIAVPAEAQGTPRFDRVIEYEIEFVTDSNTSCRTRNMIRTAGQRMYVTQLSVRCGTSSGLRSRTDQGLNIRIGSREVINMQCTSSRGVGRCTDGTVTRNPDTLGFVGRSTNRIEQQATVNTETIGYVTSTSYTGRSSTAEDRRTGRGEGDDSGTSTTRLSISLSGSSCRVEAYEMVSNYVIRGESGSFTNRLVRSISCRVVR